MRVVQMFEAEVSVSFGYLSCFGLAEANFGEACTFDSLAAL